MEIRNTSCHAAAAGRDGEREISLVLGYYRRVDDAFHFDPLAILATRGHAVEGNCPGDGQRCLAQNAHCRLCDLGGKVASGSDAFHLH